jgi:predicted phage terminase large subunit-like protein
MITRKQTHSYYNQAIDSAAKNGTLDETMRFLLREDLFFLIVYGLGRKDLDHDWIFDRCREVQQAPDGYLDLWAREHYKDLADTTPIFTTNGWVNHGDLSVGDSVFAPDGSQVKVLAVTKQYTDSECYEIEFGDGAKIIAGAGHKWNTREKHRYRISGTDERCTEFSSVEMSTEEMSKRGGRIDVGVAAPLYFQAREGLPINPYTLGVWLGDGHSASGRITVHCADSQIVSEICREGHRTHKSLSSDKTTGLFVIDGGISGQKNTGMTSVLRELGLKNNKHIPFKYLTGSVNQRMRLLQGLMDSDGHCNKRGTATFCNQNERLSDDVYQLAAGLGLRPRKRKYNGKQKPYWQVSFQAHTDRNPFRLKRKADRAIQPSYYRGVRTVNYIKRVPSVPTRCIQVEGGMYLAGKELVPTKNSTIITFGLTIQNIINNPEITAGIFSHTRPIAKAFLRQIKQEFENNAKLKKYFPEIFFEDPRKQSPKWSEDDGIVVKRAGNPKEATVEAWGLVDGQPIGRHFSLMVYDDVVTKESVNTPDMMKKTTEMWELSRSLTSEGGATRYIGTRYHYNDTYKTIIDRKAAIPRIYPGTHNGRVDGEPVLWTRERIAEKRREMGPYTFGCQILQDPKADETQGFLDAWLKFWPANNSSGLNTYIICDPAGEKKKENDYTAIFAVGLGADKNIYILDMVRDRLNLTERTNKVFMMHQRFQPLDVIYEKYGMQSDIQHIEFVMDLRNYRFNITPIGGKTGKLDRIKRLIPYFEGGRIFLPQHCIYRNYEGVQSDLVLDFINDEYKPFPVPIHDDMLDCLARILDPAITLIYPAIYQEPKIYTQAEEDFAIVTGQDLPGSNTAAYNIPEDF